VFLYGLLYSPLLISRVQDKEDFGGLGGNQCYKGDMRVGFSVLFHCNNRNRSSNFCVSLTACFPAPLKLHA
jgi:hypothetical protein